MHLCGLVADLRRRYNGISRPSPPPPPPHPSPPLRPKGVSRAFSSVPFRKVSRATLSGRGGFIACSCLRPRRFNFERALRSAEFCPLYLCVGEAGSASDEIYGTSGERGRGGGASEPFETAEIARQELDSAYSFTISRYKATIPGILEVFFIASNFASDCLEINNSLFFTFRSVNPGRLNSCCAREKNIRQAARSHKLVYRLCTMFID